MREKLYRPFCSISLRILREEIAKNAVIAKLPNLKFEFYELSVLAVVVVLSVLM